MQVLILRSLGGNPESEFFLLAPDDMLDPETVASLALQRLVESVGPDFTWEQAIEPLAKAGFLHPSRVTYGVRPWDEAKASNIMTFKVKFPVAAEHEHAGKTLTATNTLPFENGMMTLIDEHQQYLVSSDQLWDRDKKYLEQVPLGPVELPHNQFATPTLYQRAHRMLTASGFIVEGTSE